MELPIRAPAPVVAESAAVLRALVANQCRCRPFQHDLTGLVVLPHTSMAHIARCPLARADQAHLARLLSAAPWREDAAHHRRRRFPLQETTRPRRRRRESLVVPGDTPGAPVGRLFDHADRHDNYSDGTSALAHHPVPRLYGSGPARFPPGLRRSRRDEAPTPRDAAGAKQLPELKLPADRKARDRLHPQVAPVWRQDPGCRAPPARLRTDLALAIGWVAEASRSRVPCGGAVCDARYVAEGLVRVVARRQQDWVRRLTANRLLARAGVRRRAINGWALKLPGPRIAVAALVPLIPATASRPLTGGEHTSGCVPRRARTPGWGEVRSVVSVEPESVTGRSAVPVANRVDGSAAKLMGPYRQRWPTATCYQDRKGHLGVTEYRMRSADAIGNHGCPAFAASALWPLTCLPAGPARPKGLIQTRGDACRQQGRALLQQLMRFVHDQLSHGVAIEHVFDQLCAKQRGMGPV